LYPASSKAPARWISALEWHFFHYDRSFDLYIVVENDLYHNELRLYKNFFQPVMNLASKERVGGSIKRRYEVARTPYQRLME